MYGNGSSGIRFEGGKVEVINGNAFTNLNNGVHLTYGTAEIIENRFQKNYRGVYVGPYGGMGDSHRTASQEILRD